MSSDVVLFKIFSSFSVIPSLLISNYFDSFLCRDGSTDFLEVAETPNV